MDTQDVNGNDWLEYQPERCGGATDKGPKRAENQDAFWIPDQNTPTDLGALYLVADGVGGQQDGAVASKLAVETVQRYFYEFHQQGEPIPGVLKHALEKANQVILEDAQKRQVRKMGSTFVAAVIDRDKLMVAHVGDARAYLVRKGELRQLTRDDTWVQRQVDAGLITEEEAARHEFRNVVTQVLGNKPEINVNLSRSHALQPGDAIMLCSDGLYDVLSDSQMVSLISDNEPQAAARLLVEAAIEAEATDNITAVVVRTGEAPPIADEPTLVSVPVAAAAIPTVASTVAEEATLTTLPPVEDAKTVAFQAPPPISPATKEEEKGGISKWLIILAIVAVLLILGAVGAFWLRSSNFASDVDKAVETAQPEIAETLPAEIPGLKTLVPTMTIEVLVPTEEPTSTPTPTSLPDTPTPEPTPTIQVVSDKSGCVKSGLVAWVWEENQVRTGTCDIALKRIDAGTQVRILGDQSLLGEGACTNARFIKVQSEDDITTVGWVGESYIDPLDPGGSCVP